ncbi:MAG: aldose 1-epimerase family protein [Acholeplasmataceae bacterium]|nr:aldose 1-epimerase family protein [Acholeplasmataceae bacterium]
MILKNSELTIIINSLGAELTSILRNDIEYIWQADPKYWKRSSPVLFPIVGRLIDDEYVYNDKVFHLSQHGFARDHEFKLISYDINSATYLLKENSETLKIYPFKFDLYIKYELIHNQIKITYIIKNNNSKNMYFQIGAHPAFNFSNGSIIDVFKTTNQYLLKGNPQITEVYKNIDVKNIIIDDQTFINDAIIFDHIDEITLKDTFKSVTLKSKGFPFFGIWSKRLNGKNAPFICLEPWYGLTDFADHDKDITRKTGINVLEENKTFECSYIIEVS